MPVDERFTVRGYRDGDERQILDLFARSFHAPRAPEHWAWKYQHNPFGNQHISMAFDEGRLVGHYAGYPVRFRDRGRTLLAHQVGDTMTDPEVRHVGRGASSVLGRTALHFYRTFCEGEVAFNYGFNVANIQRFSLRFLRSDRVDPVTYRVRAPLPAIGRVARWGRGYQLELVTRAGAEFDELHARAAGDYGLLVQRDARYLQWRYLDCPDVPYTVVAIRKWRQLAGWIVFRIRDRRFTWGDAFFDARFPDAVEVMLRHVVPSYPVDEIEGWFPRRPAWFDEILRSLGFEERPEPQDLSLMCVPFLREDAVSAMRQSLYYTWGDSDLF
jgi:hypothetical protein